MKHILLTTIAAVVLVGTAFADPIHSAAQRGDLALRVQGPGPDHGALLLEAVPAAICTGHVRPRETGEIKDPHQIQQFAPESKIKPCVSPTRKSAANW